MSVNRGASFREERAASGLEVAAGAIRLPRARQRPRRRPFAHGVGVQTATLGATSRPELAAGHRVIRPRPGRWARHSTPRCAPTRTLRSTGLADIVADVIAELGLAIVTLVANDNRRRDLAGGRRAATRSGWAPSCGPLWLNAFENYLAARLR